MQFESPGRSHRCFAPRRTRSTAPGRALREGLGIEIAERAAVHPVGQGKWAVEVLTEDALAFWSSEAQAAAIDALPHDAEFAAIEDFVLVRTPGVITSGRLDDILAGAGAARAFFTQAAARSPQPVDSSKFAPDASPHMVLRNSSSASRSATDSCWPYVCPPLPLPRSDVLKRTPCFSASGPDETKPTF